MQPAFLQMVFYIAQQQENDYALREEKINFDIYDNSPVAYSVVEVLLDGDKKPYDWIYRYCNHAFADIKGYALLVEDNELNMEIAQYILENNGLLVDLAVNGEEAVEMFKNSEQDYYDVIFMDIMMPGLNGWDATRQIRTMKRSDAERVPIIAMSAPIWMKQ